MIERVEIRNWQALRRVDLDMGRFTVIVGPSSSGKSGFIRAMKAVASNVRGTGMITRGQKTCAITVKTGETTVTLERGDGSGVYRVLDEAGQAEKYTKLAGGVPEQVTDVLRIAPVPTGGTSINFAGQFDKPYLLDESGANVARELGELTNVNVIFEAVRLANKKRVALSSTLKTRQADLSVLVARVAEFADLPAKLAAVTQAEQIAELAAGYAERVNRLRGSINQLGIADHVLSAARVAEVPSIDVLLTVKAGRDRLVALLTQVSDALRAKYEAAGAANRATVDEQRLTTELNEVLRAAGACPLCGQRVH